MTQAISELNNPQIQNPHLEIALTNLGKYNEGELAFEWVRLPADIAELQKAFAAIGIDGRRYEEYFITDYDCSVSGLTSDFGEYENLQELNDLAERLEEMSDDEIDMLEAAIDVFGGDFKDKSMSDVAYMVNITYNLDNFHCIPNCSDHDDLGRYWAEVSIDFSNMGELERYFDYEAYGRDIDMDSTGAFSSNGNYIYHDGGDFADVYERPDYEKQFSEPDRSDGR